MFRHSDEMRQYMKYLESEAGMEYIDISEQMILEAKEAKEIEGKGKIAL